MVANPAMNMLPNIMKSSILFHKSIGTFPLEDFLNKITSKFDHNIKKLQGLTIQLNHLMTFLEMKSFIQCRKIGFLTSTMWWIQFQISNSMKLNLRDRITLRTLFLTWIGESKKRIDFLVISTKKMKDSSEKSKSVLKTTNTETWANTIVLVI